LIQWKPRLSRCALAAYTNGFADAVDSGGVNASCAADHGPVTAGALRTAIVVAPKPRLATSMTSPLAGRWSSNEAQETRGRAIEMLNLRATGQCAAAM
jgi:hypothetical protein